MKKQIIIIALSIAAIGFNAYAENENKSEVTVDPDASKIEWLGKKVTGEHKGTIEIESGELVLENEKLVGGSFTINMNSITNTDIENPSSNQKLVGHLKSDDFFGVEQYPVSKLVITEVMHESGNKYNVKGDLTIKGITKNISFPVQLSMSGSKAWASAAITIDRSDFDVKYGSGSFFDGLGDKMIYDDFTLNVSLTATK